MNDTGLRLVGNAHPTVYQKFWRSENAKGERAIQLKIQISLGRDVERLITP